MVRNLCREPSCEWHCVPCAGLVLRWVAQCHVNLTTSSPESGYWSSDFHPHSNFFFAPSALLYSTWHAPSHSFSFPVPLPLPGYLPLSASLSLSALSLVFCHVLTGGSLVLIVCSLGKSERGAVQSYKPTVTPSLFLIKPLQEHEAVETHAYGFTSHCLCAGLIERNTYLFVLFLCWLWATL